MSDMNRRVLFVDDDPMLLTSMKRCLGMQFDLETAPSGPEGLRAIEEASEPFPVVITDMRMPVMDGIEFLRRAKEVSKDSIYMMLTGNQDVQTAIRAVNEGQVARFLNKPCDPSEISAAIDNCLKQYESDSAERELLNHTFVGAIGILADVMETLKPDLLGRAAGAEQVAEALREACGIKPLWEYSISAKLSLVGFAMHPAIGTLPPASPQATARLAQASESAARMIQRIPRMEKIAQIVRAIPTTDGDIPVTEPRGDGDVVVIGAAILRVAQLIEELSHLGIDSEQAEQDIRKALPNAYEPLLAAIKDVYPVIDNTDGVGVVPSKLQPGMVLLGNLERSDGAMLLRSGRRLSETHIEKLRSEIAEFDEDQPILVTRNSYEEATGSSAELQTV